MSIKNRINVRVTRFLSYLHRRAQGDIRRGRPIEIVWEMSAKESAEFIYERLDAAVLFEDRRAFWRHVLNAVPSDGLVMECGVFEGDSINFIADWMQARGDKRKIDGFDSFEGLEEDWAGEALPKGFFNLGGRLPDVRDSVRLHKGWVQDTIQPYLTENPDRPIGLLHIDTDTYSPARYLLENLRHRFPVGAVIVFDELIGYPNWRQHEYRALCETLPEESYEFIAFTSRQAAIRIVEAITD